MNILIINSGSSSLKFQLLSGKEFNVVAKGIIDGIGLKQTKLIFKSEKRNIGVNVTIKDHHDALILMFKNLKNSGVIDKYSEIDAIGHRVVHGGEKYTKPIKIDATVIKEIKILRPLAPLHNPANLEGIKGCKKILPKTPQVAIFDTSFHQTIPKKAYLYGLPYDLYTKHHIRRYGFHGSSHKYVIEETLKILKKKTAKIISCHLGNGSSITAYNEKVMDTSMGFTPLEGITMGTRSGSIDPAIVLHLQTTLKMKPEKVDNLLNNKSGLKGLSLISSDMRKIYKASLKKDKQALLAIEILSYQIAKYLGAYAATLNGLDAIVFTGGIGENAFYIREKACSYLKFMGLKIDQKKNEANETKISDSKSKIKVFVIPTNEELQIAKETAKVLKK